MYKTKIKMLHEDIVEMLKYGLSDAYIEASLYGTYKDVFSLKDINNIIQLYKNDIKVYENI
jgi:hypothetical protein